MKKTIRIHISGYIFNIEEDAYTILEEWLEKISIQYSGEEGGDEIVNDIEMRVAELFQEELGMKEAVISSDIVSKIIKVMGMPEEFEDEESKQKVKTETNDQKKNQSARKKSWKKKRLYRDDENNLLGGVCSGLGNYFDIDPIIIRVVFIITIVFGGFGTIAYILLWIIVPKAETTAQKLEMKGEPVNISNIEKVIKEEFEIVKNRIIDKTKSENFRKFKKKINNSGNNIADSLERLFKGVYGIIGFVFVLAGVLAIIALFSFIFQNSIPNFLLFNTSILEWKPFIGLLPVPFSSTYISVLVFIIIAIPFIMLVLFGTKALFGYRSNGKFIGYTGLVLWIAGIILASFAAIKVSENYTAENSLSKTEVIEKSTSNTLYLSLNKNYDKKFNDPKFELSNYNIINTKKSMKLYGKPRLNIVKSNNEDIKINLSYNTNGKTKKDAYNRAQNIKYFWEKKDSTLSFFPYFTLKGNENKIYKRELQITLEIPEGKAVYIDSNLIGLIYDIENIQNIWDEDMVGKKWLMTKDGLSLIKNELKNIEQLDEEMTEGKDTLNLKTDTIKVSTEISI